MVDADPSKGSSWLQCGSGSSNCCCPCSVWNEISNKSQNHHIGLSNAIFVMQQKIDAGVSCTNTSIVTTSAIIADTRFLPAAKTQPSHSGNESGSASAN